MSQKDQGNRESERGMAKGKGKREAKTVEELYAGSSDGEGLRFKVHDHPDKSDMSSPEED